MNPYIASTPEVQPATITLPAGEEPFNIAPTEIEETWGQPDLPSGEKAVRKCFERIAEVHFTLDAEVVMRNPNGDRLRIDYVGREKSGKVQGLIGFEMKSICVASTAFSDFGAAVAQSIDYAKARIESDRYDGDWFGRTLKWVFMFPCPYQIYEHLNSSHTPNQRDMWAQGALKLAGKFGVGSAAYIGHRKEWGLFLGGHPAFWMKSGPDDKVFSHSKIQQIGSGR